MHDIDLQLEHMLKGEFEEGWKISEKLQALGKDNILDPQGNKNPEMWLRHNFNRGWFLLQQGNYREGSQLLESGRFINVYGSGHLQTSAPIYNPEEHDIKGKSIIISLEGGYGDEIIHSRFAQTAKKLGANKVYLAAAPEIASIFTRVPGVDGVIQRDQSHTVQHDYWIPGFSAGWVLGHTYDNLPNEPYLSPIPSSYEVWSSIIKNNGKKKVGIRWSGNPKFEHQQFRRFPPEFMINLAKHEDLDIYSLQRDHNLQILPENITDLQYLLISWEDTLSALSQLDLIITSCTSIAHAAAALGKETWVFTPTLPYHTWTLGAPESKTSPFYKSVRVYRQTNPTKWNDVFQEMYQDLENEFNLKHIDLPSCDKECKKINLGCGFDKVKGYDNVDYSPIVRPDRIVDLNSKNWDIPDGEYDHIVAKDIIEHLDDTVNVIKEMYRISKHGAIWEIQVPHHRSDLALIDPTHKRLIHPDTFKMFDMKFCMDKFSKAPSEAILCLQNNIDIEVCLVEYIYNTNWLEMFEKNKATQEDVSFSLNNYNNVAALTKILVQVHKPPRYSQVDIDRAIDEYFSNK